MSKNKTYQVLARTINAIGNCINSDNTEWEARHRERMSSLLKTAPTGSGIDAGIALDLNAALRNPQKLVFTFSFHHMDDQGGYDGWTDHKAIIKPSLMFGLDLTITGSNRNEIKNYLQDTFLQWLESEVAL